MELFVGLIGVSNKSYPTDCVRLQQKVSQRQYVTGHSARRLHYLEVVKTCMKVDCIQLNSVLQYCVEKKEI